MTYLINFSDAENAGSLVQESRVMIPISVSFTLDGVGGLQVGNLFKVDYLPETYRDFVHFMITKVEHTISTTGWDTSIESVMIADMKEVWQKSGKQLQKGLEDYLDLFKITEINEFNITKFSSYADEQDRINNEKKEIANKKAIEQAQQRVQEVSAIASGQNRGGNPFSGG